MGEERIERIGNVRFYNDPMASKGPGVDVAIVELPHPPNAAEYDEAPLVKPPIDELTIVTLFGARSRRRRGFIFGELQSEKAADGRIWRNVWGIVQMTSGFAKPGDSEGPVFVQGNVAMGHLVAALGTPNWRGRFQCGIVQDIATTVTFLEQHYGQSVVILAKALPTLIN